MKKKDDSFLWIALTNEEMAWVDSTKKRALDLAACNDGSAVTLLLKINRRFLPLASDPKTIEVK